MIVSLNIFAHNRLNLFLPNLVELNKINKNSFQIEMNILLDDYCDPKLVNLLKNTSQHLNFNMTFLKFGNYMEKIRFMSKVKNKLVFKVDEDIFLSQKSWENFFSSTNNFKSFSNLALAPCISTGIPTVELFLNNNFKESERKKILEIFESQKFLNWQWKYFLSKIQFKIAKLLNFLNKYNRIKKIIFQLENSFGEIEYKSLNGKYASGDITKFYAAVRSLKHKYKGIHSVRINQDVQFAMNRYIINNFEKIEKNNLNNQAPIRITYAPYFCSSIYYINGRFLRLLYILMYFKILPNDGFEELALNKLLDWFNRPIGFFSNINAYHPTYNTIDEVMHQSINLEFYDFICNYSKLNEFFQHIGEQI
jgi:hypothetical protein